MQALRQGMQNGDRLRDLRRKLDHIPEDLRDLYRYLLDAIHPADRQKAYQTFAVALEITKHNMQNMSLFRCSFLDDLEDDSGILDKAGSESVRMDTDEVNRRVERVKARLNGCCGSLFEVREGSGRWRK